VHTDFMTMRRMGVLEEDLVCIVISDVHHVRARALLARVPAYWGSGWCGGPSDGVGICPCRPCS